MPPEILNILFSALGIIVTGLATWLVSRITSWINSKIQDAKAAHYINQITSLVSDAVCATYQTYVEALKNEGKFDEEAQKKAFNLCLEKIKTQLAPNIIDYITNNFGDMEEYLGTLIESTIYTIKK